MQICPYGLNDASSTAHKREVAARVEELAEWVIEQVAVRRMKARHELKERAWHRVLMEGWDAQGGGAEEIPLIAAASCCL